jgi:hypothetical protein
MQRRLHPRVRLRLPARLRWSAPLGQRMELCETINVSRGGLLLTCKQLHADGLPLWVTFPFDPASTAAQPETLARVVRCAESNGDAPARWKVALHFEGTAYSIPRQNGHYASPPKRNGSGNEISLPIRVRPKTVPWHEDAMTTEVTQDKIKFVTHREYALGERLCVSFVSRIDAPWAGNDEWETQVIGVEMREDSDSLRVTVRKDLAK